MHKVVGYYLSLAGWRIVKGLRPARLYRELMEREFWSATQWKSFQDELIRDFVKHCYENVPFYRERFDSIKLRPDDIRTSEDITKIPVLTKDDVRANEEKLIARNYNKNDLSCGHTTGSTGKPLTFYGCRERSEYIIAGIWRIYRRCGWQPGEPTASIWGFSGAHIKMPFWKKFMRDLSSGTTHLNAWQANNDDFSQWYRLLQKRKPTVLVCYGSSGSRFARWLLDNNETFPLKGVYCTSEKLYDWQRHIMGKAFGCRVYDLYGCGEAIHLACSCPEGNMHTNPDISLIQTGEPDELERRPFYVTGLRNWAMPFLRYENGDSGDFKGGQCKCQRQSPMIELTVSRISDVFKFANGKKFPSLYFVLRLYKPGFEGIELFQFHQDKIDHIGLKVVKNRKFTEDTQGNLDAAVAEIEEHIDNQASVELIFCDSIEQPSENSKHYYAKSDVK